MAEPRIYIAPLASIVAVTSDNVAVPLGIVQQLTLTKSYMTEEVPEWGNYAAADILIYGYRATFSWEQAWSEGFDLVGAGLVPSDAAIAQFRPFYLRVIDRLGQRNIAMIHKGVADTYTVSGQARARLNSNISGIAISLQYESEIN